MSLSTSTSCHYGNTLLCKETVQCCRATSGKILIPHYNATTLSLRCTLGEKIDNAGQKQKKQIWPNGLAESSTVLVQNFDDQLCNWSTIKLPRNGVKHKCKLLKSCQAQMQAPWPGERVEQDNALKPQDRLWLECLNYHIRVFSNEFGGFCQCHEKVCEIKNILCKVIVIAGPAWAYLDNKCNRSWGRLSIGWRGSWGTGLV